MTRFSLLALLFAAVLFASDASASAALSAPPPLAMETVTLTPEASVLDVSADPSGPVLVADTREASTHQPNRGGMVALVGSLLALVGFGTVVNLRTKKADGTFDNHRLDSESDDFGAQMQGYRDGVETEVTTPLRADLTAAETERDEFRGIVIDEILRVETLAHTDADGNLSDDFSADDERGYYESLTPKKLALHYKKAREKTVDLKPQTSPDAPTEGDDAAYGHVTVN